ncbi:MAG: hypothetical protein G01um101431_633 [Parcubacteria group bacterium Gr01-1014_31]|nr:MAG: hypothetical protein G01um101431_633 [Parcubacteria group bacterium Gr01-1014_31]
MSYRMMLVVLPLAAAFGCRSSDVLLEDKRDPKIVVHAWFGETDPITAMRAAELMEYNSQLTAARTAVINAKEGDVDLAERKLEQIKATKPEEPTMILVDGGISNFTGLALVCQVFQVDHRGRINLNGPTVEVVNLAPAPNPKVEPTTVACSLPEGYKYLFRFIETASGNVVFETVNETTVVRTVKWAACVKPK